MYEKVNKIIKELIEIQIKNPDWDLFQFKSAIGAYQYERLYKLIFKYLEPESKVLDWGCGNGHFSYFLVQMNYQTYGFSFADFLLSAAIDPANNYQFTKGIFEQPVTLPYPDNYFDAVVSVGVLEHVKETGGDEIKSLEEIHRILKPKGLFICYHFPNKFSLIEKIVSYFPTKYSHPDLYTSQDIKQMCAKTGFEILELKRYGFLPRNFWGNYYPAIGNSPVIAYLYNLLDIFLGFILSPLCQNYLFVVRK